MVDQRITDDVQSILTEISNINTEFQNALEEARTSGNSTADVLAALQPIADRLTQMDSSFAPQSVAPVTDGNATDGGEVSPTGTGASSNDTVGDASPPAQIDLNGSAVAPDPANDPNASIADAPPAPPSGDIATA